MKLKEKIKLSALWSLVIAGMFLVSKNAHCIGEGDSGPMADRVFTSEGTILVPFQVTVGTVTPVDLYAAVSGSATYSFSPQSTSTYKYNPRLHFFTELTNPSTNYNLCYSSWAFSDSDAHGVIPSNLVSTATYKTGNHSPMFLKFEAGASSQTIRGVVKVQG